jgi:hypothetical protein
VSGCAEEEKVKKKKWQEEEKVAGGTDHFDGLFLVPYEVVHLFVGQRDC